MESAKGFIFLVLCCSLLSCIEARPHEKKKTVKHWWDEDWSSYFKEGQDSKKLDNHIADSQYHKDFKDAKAQVPVKPKASLVKAKAEENKPAKEEASVKPLGKHVKPTLYNPTEENRWDDKDYNKFVEDDDDLKDYGDYDDVEDLEDEDSDEDSDEDYSDEDSDLYSDEYSDEEEEEKDYKEIEDAKASKAAQEAKNKMESDVSEKKTTNYHSIGFDTGIVPEEKHADEKELISEQKESSKEGMIDMFPDLDAHSVKKDLMNPAFMKDYANTKPDLKTSPNPPPPGLGESKLAMVTPSGKKTEKEQKMQLIQSKPLTMCQVDADCRVGRKCHDNVCFCLPSDGCQKHYKPVCGSDNNWYPSHCELHRSACIHGQHIKIDHSGMCFKTQEKLNKEQALAKAKEQDIGPVIDKSEIDIDTDIPQDAIKSPIINSGEIYDYPKGSPKGKDVVKERKPLYDDNKVSLADKEKAKMVEGKGKEKKECTREEYENFKQKLLEYHCKKFTEPNCRTEVQEEREYLATLMFSFYDRDLDFFLDEKEANEMEEKEHFEHLSTACVLADIIKYAEKEPRDMKMSVTEFIAAFNGSMDKWNLKQEAQVIPTLATVGNGLELKCGVGSDVIWRRFNTDIHELNNDELTVFEDGSLFFSKVGVHHMGNYTCEDRNNPLQTQIHSLRVQMRPVVQVFPPTLMKETNTDIVVKCHAEGIPRPKISWEVNEISIPDTPHHFLKTHENGTLTVQRADYLRDTGAYKCIAHNQAGEAEDVASVFIQNPNKTQGFTESSPSSGSFIAFHRKGYTAYDPAGCTIEREVLPTFGNFKFIPDNIDSPLQLCDVDKGCEWGTAVEVKDFVYVSQPKQNRVVVVETAKKINPIQVIDTDKSPMELHYVEHLDQVWVLCWNSDKDSSLKTIVVIRDASKYIQHHAVHTQPVADRFDMVQDLFLPPSNDLHHAYNYGYVTHNTEQGLFKLNLKSMKYVKAIDFSAYNCVPKTVVFVPIGGHVIVQCVSKATHETTQLVMDYLTDAVKSKKVVTGKPYVSPDSRHIVTADDFSGKVSVLAVSSDGTLESEFEVTLSCSISDIAFFSSSKHTGYDVVLTSADDEDIFFLSLTNGKLDKIKGSTLSNRDWKPQPMKKTLIPGGMFNDYLLSSLPTAVRIINGKRHSIQCTFEGPMNTHVIAFFNN